MTTTDHATEDFYRIQETFADNVMNDWSRGETIRYTGEIITGPAGGLFATAHYTSGYMTGEECVIGCNHMHPKADAILRRTRTI